MKKVLNELCFFSSSSSKTLIFLSFFRTRSNLFYRCFTWIDRCINWIDTFSSSLFLFNQSLSEFNIYSCLLSSSFHSAYLYVSEQFPGEEREITNDHSSYILFNDQHLNRRNILVQPMKGMTIENNNQIDLRQHRRFRYKFHRLPNDVWCSSSLLVVRCCTWK